MAEVVLYNSAVVVTNALARSGYIDVPISLAKRVLQQFGGNQHLAVGRLTQILRDVVEVPIAGVLPDEQPEAVVAVGAQHLPQNPLVPLNPAYALPIDGWHVKNPVPNNLRLEGYVGRWAYEAINQNLDMHGLFIRFTLVAMNVQNRGPVQPCTSKHMRLFYNKVKRGYRAKKQWVPLTNGHKRFERGLHTYSKALQHALEFNEPIPALPWDVNQQ